MEKVIRRLQLEVVQVTGPAPRNSGKERYKQLFEEVGCRCLQRESELLDQDAANLPQDGETYTVTESL